MKHVLFLILSVLSTGLLNAQDTDCLLQDSELAVEKISYNLKYKWGFIWLNAGLVTFETKLCKEKQDTLYDFKAVGKTYDSYNWIFEVNDTFQSRVRKSDFSPVWFKRNLLEGNYKHQEVDVYTQDSILHQNKLKPFRSKDVVKLSCARDILSLVYYIRQLPEEQLKNKKQLQFTLHLEKEFYQISVKYKGQESIEIDDKKVLTDVLAISLLEGDYFKDDGNMLIYVSQDANRIPLLIESPLRVGKIQAELIKN